MVYGRSTKSKARKSIKTNRKRSTVKATSSIKKAVKTVIKSMAEKQISPSYTWDDNPLTSFNTSTSAPPFVIPLLSPLNAIVQGSGQGNRQGNRIRLSKMPLRVMMDQPAGNVTPSVNLVGKFIIAKMKSSIDTPIITDFNRLFQDGNTSNSITNSVFQNFLPFNKDVWDIKKVIPFKLNSDAEVYQPANGLGQYKQFSVDIARYLPKTIIYSDTDTNPTNCGLYGFIIVGSTTVSNDAYTVNLNMSTWAEYYDL